MSKGKAEGTKSGSQRTSYPCVQTGTRSPWSILGSLGEAKMECRAAWSRDCVEGQEKHVPLNTHVATQLCTSGLSSSTHTLTRFMLILVHTHI